MCLSSISPRPPSYRVAFEIETRGERESVIKWLAHFQLYLSGTCHTLLRPRGGGCRSRCDAISPIRQAGERRDINFLLSRRTTNLPYLSIVLKECERTVGRRMGCSAKDPVAVTRDDTTRRRRQIRSLLRRTTGRGTMKSYFKQT